MFNSKKIKRPDEKNDPDSSWDRVAVWYDDLLGSGESTYQKDLILPNTLRLLELQASDQVLDLGCGQGFFAREFFKAGAAVTGVDISENLIVLAKKQSPKEIRFIVSSADRLNFLASGSVNIVTCILAIQNMRNVSAVLAESSRVLKSGSRMLLVMNHPTFRIARRSSWGFDEKSKIQYRRIDEYLSESVVAIQMRPGTQPSLTTMSFHHPLQFYFKALQKAGFMVSRLEEWNSAKKSEPGPRAAAENKARKEFPLFLALEAKKLA